MDLGKSLPFQGPQNTLRSLYVLGGGLPNLPDKSAGNLSFQSLEGSGREKR